MYRFAGLTWPHCRPSAGTLNSTSGRTLKKASEGTRTLDIQLGKLALYQLSYARDKANIAAGKQAANRVTMANPRPIKRLSLD